MSEGNEKPVGFYEYIQPICDKLDIFKGVIKIAVPYGGMFTFPGLAQRRKLFGVFPWFPETLVKGIEEPRYNPDTDSWEGPFTIEIWDESKTRPLINELESLGIKCEWHIRDKHT